MLMDRIAIKRDAGKEEHRHSAMRVRKSEI